jgi:hypothetical protein
MSDWYKEGYGDNERENVTCKYCEEDGFHWVETGGKGWRVAWRLADEDGKIHDCPKFRKRITSQPVGGHRLHSCPTCTCKREITHER